MSALWTILGLTAAFVVLGLLTRGRAPRLAFDFTDEGRLSERCSACETPCDRPERIHD
ncbi:MAG: hypothetical protein QNJ90_01915 [Planctomycetota bacterium]|nr:hypothetical protein [Planctomycetota bacterium]